MTISPQLARVLFHYRCVLPLQSRIEGKLGFVVRLMLVLFFMKIFAVPLFSANQDSTRFPFMIGVRPQYGFIIIHSKDIVPVKDSYPFGLSLDLSWHFNSQKAYQQCLCFPRIGISNTFWDYDSNEILGRGFNSIFFIEPYYGINNKVSFSLRGGTGLAFANKPYDEISNPENLSYSTRFSFALLVAANLNVWLSERMMMSLSANYNHISNGGMKQPNKGINYPTLGVGLDYYLMEPDFRKFPRTDWRDQSKNRDRIMISAFMTTRELNIDGEQKKYPAGGINLRMSRQVSRINAVGGAVEVMADWSNRERIRLSGQNTSHLMAGVLAGNDFLLGKFVFGQQFGVYIYNPYGNTPDLFQRYFLDFNFTKNLSTGIGLKAHGHVADFLDFRFGFAL